MVVSAYTGIAANLLIGGTTSHKAFGLPFEDEGLNLNRSLLKLQSREAEKLRECEIIVWDEATMVTGWQLHVADKILREVTQNYDVPFGNKIVILGGDFHQILPTVPRGSRADIVDAAITSTNLWPLFKVVRLKQNMRVAQDRPYADWLQSVGDGTANDGRSFRIDVPSNLLRGHLDQLIDFCFGKDFDKDDMTEAAILSTTNDIVNYVNELILDRYLQKKPDKRSYYSHTDLVFRRNDGEDLQDQERMHLPLDYLSSLQSAGLPPHHLKLCEGLQVMLIRNLRLCGGLCNGTRLKIEKMYDNMLLCKVMSGSKKGTTVAIFRVTFYSDEFSLPGQLRRHQFPIKACFCMTINKSQGQTLKRVGLYLKAACSVHGQFFVGTSRVRSGEDIKIVVEDSSNQGRKRKESGFGTRAGNIFTQNPVYTEVLRAVQMQVSHFLPILFHI